MRGDGVAPDHSGATPLQCSNRNLRFQDGNGDLYFSSDCFKRPCAEFYLHLSSFGHILHLQYAAFNYLRSRRNVYDWILLGLFIYCANGVELWYSGRFCHIDALPSWHAAPVGTVEAFNR